MNELALRLSVLAVEGRTSTYGQLARDLGWRMARLTAELELLMAEDAAAGQPQRAALLEGRLNNGLPARGFFDRLADLGLAPADPATFVADTRAALFAAART